MTVDYSGQGQAVLGLVHPSNFAENCCTVLLLSLTLFPFGRETCHQPDSVLCDSLVGTGLLQFKLYKSKEQSKNI